ncbi:MAG: hypothetical protein NTY39_09810 [Campylobacterales bacterium]|nr:hypothetical protein [Campylobacterales bacterium]
MIALNLNIREEVYEKIIYFLQSLPKKDVQIVQKRVIDEIDPTILPKEHFDYISKNELDEMSRLVEEAKRIGFDKLKSFDEL